MAKEKVKLTQKGAENSPAGGVVVGKRNGQTMIYDDASVGGYFVGKTHSKGGIKMINKSNGQPLEVQGSEVIITAPAVADQTKNEFNGKMMTNREILSQINVNGGGVAFAEDGMEIPKSVKRTGASYNYGGKTMTDHEIYKHITGGHLAEGMTLSQIAKKHKVSLKELQKQVDKGMKAESEHTSSKREQMKIVKDHLYENPKYYTLLKKAGLEDGGKVGKFVIGKEYTGSQVRKIVSEYGSQEGTDMDEFAEENIDLKDNYVFEKISISKLLDYDVDLKSFIDDEFDENIKYTYKKVNDLNNPILLGDNEYNQTENVVLDGYHRVLQKLENGEDDVFALVKKSEYKRGGAVGKESLVRDAKSGNTPARDLNNYNDVIDLQADGMVGADTGIYARGGMVVTSVKEIPNFEQRLNERRISYRGLGSGKLADDFYELAGESGTRIKVDGKEYYITDKEFDTFSRDENGRFRVRFEAPERKYDGGEININPFLNYYFEELKDFLKSQNNIILKDDYTFYYKGENFTIEPIIVSDINTSESIKEANFIIYDIEDDIVGDIVFNPNNNKKFEANSDFFDWNNIKFYDGGNVKPYDANMEGDSADMVFDEGGATDLPKVNFVKVSSTGSSLSSLTGKEFYSFKEFKEAVESVYKTLNQNVKSSIYLAVNGVGITFSTYISSGKNTVANFNPYTGKPSDLEKVFIKRHRYRFNQYNWQDWFGVQEKAKTTRGKKAPTQTPTSTPASTGKPIDLKSKKIWVGDNQELAKKVLKRAKELGWSGAESEKRTCYYFTSSFLILGSNRERSLFDDQTNYEEIFESDLFETETPASSGKFSAGEIDVFNQIDKIVEEQGIIDVTTDDIYYDNKTKDFTLENKQTGEFFIFRKYLDSLGVPFEITGSKEKLKALIKDYKEWKASTPASTNESKGIEVTSMIIKYFDNDGKELITNIDNVLDLKKQFDTILNIESKFIYLFPIEGANPTGYDSRIYLTLNPSDDEDFDTIGSSVTDLKSKLKNIIFKDQNYNWNKFFDWTEKESQTQTPTTPEPVKSNRNFELERKYLTGRINDLSKELDMKRPSLLNEEIAFYQREINKFILKLRKVMNDQNEEKPITERIEAVYGVKWGDYDKQYPETDLVSYNGVKSELTQEEYLKVRTPEFKAFFGDWEQGSSAGYSKVINPKTKEPLAVWHGTNVLFTEWKTYATNNAHYFSTKRDFSEFFASEWESRTDKAGVDSKVLKDLNPNKGKFMFRCFIDVRNPIDFSRFGVDKRPISDYLTFLKINYNIGDYDFWTGLGNASGVTKDTKVYAWQIIRLWQNFTTYVKLYTTYDGYIFYEYNPNTPSGGIDNASLCFCAFESNQVKFTNAYEFNALSNDSRFDFGGDI